MHTIVVDIVVSTVTAIVVSMLTAALVSRPHLPKPKIPPPAMKG